MSHNVSWDALEFDKLDFPYNRIEAELSEEPRFIRGLNASVSLGGKLCKRNGNLPLTNTYLAGYRIDRLWLYETQENPPKVYIMASMFNTVLASWSMWYNRQSAATPAWTLIPNLRQVNASTRAHEAVSSRGLFYIKGYPTAASGEKLGSVIFDGSATGPRTQYWGLLAPTVPAALVGAVTKSTADLSLVGLTLNVVTSTGFPVAPFNIQVDYERMTVTSIGGGTNWTVTRAIEGTTAAVHATNSIVIWRNWSASDHQIDVNVGWAYTYAYKTSTGQVSSRAPMETNPDKLPSRTGPFQDLIPKFTLTGQADTTNIPTILVFRSTDGGGTFYQLEEITNTGAGSITYLDDSLESGSAGGTFNDPLPDTELDQADRAPTLITNNPPPTVISPEVVGTDTPDPTTPLAGYAARLWFGIGNILFFSGQEEITIGIPEECWPSGTFGNFFRFQYPITNIAATSTALYIFTLTATYELTGTNLETFNVKPLFDNLGHPYGHPRAIARYEDTVVFLTQDFRVALLEDSQMTVISDPLYTDLVDAMNQGAEFDIKVWGDLEKEWIVVAAHNQGDSLRSLQWIFDVKKTKLSKGPFWYPPWNMRISAMASGRIVENSGQRRLTFAMYEPASSGSTCLVRMDPTGRTGADYFVTENVGYIFSACTNLFMVPPGNHVNSLRKPGITPTVYAISLDRLLFSGDTDPTIYYYIDDLWSDPLTLTLEDPARVPFPKQYKTCIGGVHEVAQHVAVEFVKLESEELFESQNLIVVWNPDAGC